jgi:TonB family protein
MKSIQFFLFLLFIPFQFVSAQYKTNDSFYLQNTFDELKNSYVKNNVRAFVNRYYTIADGVLSDSVQKYELISIDENGNIIQRASFDKNRKITDLYRYFFNDKNQKTSSYHILNDRLLYKNKFYYDLSERLAERNETNELAYVNSKEYFKFHNSNFAYKSIIFGPSNVIKSISERTYNSENQLISQTFFSIKQNALSEKASADFEIKAIYETGLLKSLLLKNNEPAKSLFNEYTYESDLPAEIKQTTDNLTYIIKREYITFEQKTRNIERWLIIPDYSKFFKDENETKNLFKYAVPPQFPDGIEALKRYVKDNLNYPKKAKKEGIEGIVILGFFIDQNGTVGNIRIFKSVTTELDDAAIEMVNKMPKWQPALNEAGKAVMSDYELAVFFELE